VAEASANRQAVVLAHHLVAALVNPHQEEVLANRQALVSGNLLVVLANNHQEAVALDHHQEADLASRQAVVLVPLQDLALGMPPSNQLEASGINLKEEASGNRRQEVLRINHKAALDNHKEEEASGNRRQEVLRINHKAALDNHKEEEASGNRRQEVLRINHKVGLDNRKGEALDNLNSQVACQD